MKKIQLFLTVEAILIALALRDILVTDFPRFIFLLFLLALSLRFYLGRDWSNLMLTSTALLLFFIIMANPFVVIALIIAVIYMMLNYFSRMQKHESYQLVHLEQTPKRVKRERMHWFGNQDYFNQGGVYPFDDINIVRIFGNDVIDLTEVALTGADNVIVVRKSMGTTRVIVPLGVEVDLTASAIYGHLGFLDLVDSDLRNESVKFQSHHFLNSNKRVKLVISVFFGDVEVIQR